MPQTVNIDALRDRIRRLERPAQHGVLPFGVAAIDATLPGGGLARGALHEIVGMGGDEEDGAAAAGFIAGILARLGPPSPLAFASAAPAALSLAHIAGEGGPSAPRLVGEGPVLWCLKRPDLYGPGLQVHGLDPGRLILVTARRDEDILWAVEEGLRAPGLAAVVGEIGRLPMVAGRRLQLAAERSGVTALLLRRWRNAADADAERTRPTAALTRWRIAALPSASSGRASEAARVEWLRPNPDPPPLAGEGMSTSNGGRPWVGKPRWRVELLRCRGGMPGIWDVEVADATGLVCLSAELADRPAAPGEQSPARFYPESARRRAG